MADNTKSEPILPREILEKYSTYDLIDLAVVVSEILASRTTRKDK